MIKLLRLEMKSLKDSESSILNELGYTPKLAFGVEFSNFEISEQDIDFNYLQVSAKYGF